MNFKILFERQTTMYSFLGNIFKTTHECESNLIILAYFHKQKFNLFMYIYSKYSGRKSWPVYLPD